MVRQTWNGRCSKLVEYVWCVLALTARFNRWLHSCCSRSPDFVATLPNQPRPYYSTCLHGLLLHIRCCRQYGAAYKARMCCHICRAIVSTPKCLARRSLLINRAQGLVAGTRCETHMLAPDNRVSILFPLTSHSLSFTKIQPLSPMIVVALRVEAITARQGSLAHHEAVR